MSKAGLRKFFRLAFRSLVTLLLIAGWTLAILSLHVVMIPPPGGDDASMADDSWHRGYLDFRVVVVPKDRLGLSGSFVDTRDWTLEDAADHEAVVTRLAEAGRGDVLDHIGGNVLSNEAGKKADDWLQFGSDE